MSVPARHRLRGALAGLVLGCSLGVAPVQAETLTDALIMAYRTSGLLEKNRAILRAADEDVAQAVATLRPILTYAANVTRNLSFPNDSTVTTVTASGPVTQRIEDTEETTVSMSISADLLLYDGGATRLAIEAAKELVLVTREALVATEQDVLLAAVQSYVAVRQARALVDLRENNLGLVRRELQAARDRFDVGEVTRTDVAIAEARLAAGLSNLATARGDLDQAQALYQQRVGVRPGDLAPPPNPEIAASPDAALAVARRMNPQLLQAMRSITVAELNLQRAEAAIKPRVSLGADLNVDREIQENFSVGLSMTGPIYRGGEITSLYRQAAARRDEERADLHVARQAIEQQVAAAWALVEVARSSISSSREQIRAAQVAFEGVREEATLGARTTLDVLTAEQDLLDAQATLITETANETEAIYTLLAAMGLLTVQHLNLGIVTYDPSAYYNAVRDAPVRKVSPQGQRLDSLLRSLGK